MENKYDLNTLLSKNVVDELIKYDLFNEADKMLNKTSMINIDGMDFKNVIDNKTIVAYTNQTINNPNDIKLNIVNKIEDSDILDGVIYIQGSMNVSLNICNEAIDYINKCLKKNVNFIFGLDVSFENNNLKILTIITKK